MLPPPAAFPGKIGLALDAVTFRHAYLVDISRLARARIFARLLPAGRGAFHQPLCESAICYIEAIIPCHARPPFSILIVAASPPPAPDDEGGRRRRKRLAP